MLQATLAKHSFLCLFWKKKLEWGICKISGRVIFFLYELDGLPKLPCIKIYVLSCVEIGICYYLQHFKKYEIKVYMLALSRDLKDIKI